MEEVNSVGRGWVSSVGRTRISSVVLHASTFLSVGLLVSCDVTGAFLSFSPRFDDNLDMTCVRAAGGEDCSRDIVQGSLEAFRRRCDERRRTLAYEELLL